VIFEPYAVVDPLTMVVVPLHTAVADVAVAALRGANYFAGGAKAIGVESFHELEEGNAGALLEVAWITDP